MDKYDYNLILLGGTGARCGEIFVHMCANGYFTADSITILYIDSDTENGNAKELHKAIKLYNRCRESYRIIQSPIPCFFRPRIDFMTADPVRGSIIFSDIAQQGQEDVEELRAAWAFMRALYSEEECATQILDGFFARPNVGAALFSANMEQIMEQFVDHVLISQQDLKKIKIFMLGSLFGGTGASSLPTISRYLKDRLFGQSTDKLIGDKLKIGACMAMPYFSFSREKQAEEARMTDRGIKIEADKFSTKTRSALEYYKMVDSVPDRRIFDSLYFLGHDGNDVRGQYDIAGTGQRNLPHIVEFYAASAAVAFFNGEGEGRFLAAVPDGKIQWSSLYNGKSCFFSFFIMMRFSIVLKSLILEELFDYKDANRLRKKVPDIPWFYDFIKGKKGEKANDYDADKLFDCFKPASDYCSTYIRWFSELILRNIDKRYTPHTVLFGKGAKKDSAEEDGAMDSDLVDYLDLFPAKLILKQHMNDLIADGQIEDYAEKAAAYDKIYRANLADIRKTFTDLAEYDVFSGKKVKVTMNRIWERLTSFGYSSQVYSEDVFKNIAQLEDSTMTEGTRNLINAIFVACMI